MIRNSTTTHGVHRRHRTIGALLGAGTLVLATQVGGLGESPVQAQAVVAPQPYVTDELVFTVDDILGSSAAFGSASSNREELDPTIVLGNDAGEDISGNIMPNPPTVLSPIDSSFTTDEIDFFGAIPRDRDGEYVEGYAGNIEDGSGNVIGLEVSDVATDLFRAGAPLGTWAAGLGGESIKASTEHFTVMESILTCFQTYEYDYWSSYEDYIANPTSSTLDRTNAALIAAGEAPCTDPSRALTDPNDLVGFNGEDIDFATLPANEDSVIEDMALDPDNAYSATTKDDGKLLFRWGTSVKKPTDIRFQKTIPLPPEWTDAASLPAGSPGYRVTRAELILDHNITNNPNDQIRPEDWENEAATGRLPSYSVDGSGNWVSTTDCYEGDGDFIPAGTLLRSNTPADPSVPASDLQNGYTPAWYTTIQRDPFEWSYRTPAGDLIGSHDPVDLDTLPAGSEFEGATLVSGPRWRMTSNKFGQDLPGLEIPKEECAQPPYQKGETRYDTGDRTTTTVNLLDWSQANDKWPTDAAYSPFAYSAGWITDWNDPTAGVPGQAISAEDAARCASTDGAGNCVTSLGTTLTEGFDVTFYVKGDVKPAQMYDVQLVLEWEPTPVPALTPVPPVDPPVDPPVEPPVTPPAGAASAFLPLVPSRVLDTRNNLGFALGEWDGTGPLLAGSTVSIPVRSAGVPSDATVAVANVTTTNSTAEGYISVFPCTQSPPNASNLNFRPGQDRAALTYAPVGADGRICLYSSVTTDVIVDVNGYTPAGGSYNPVAPVRIADTRASGTLAAGATLRVTPPATGAQALAVSVTSVTAAAPGYLTAYSCADGLPATSTLNYSTGEAIANLSIVGPGDICVYTSARSDVLLDVQGQFSQPVNLTKARLLDTRSGATPAAGSITRFDPTSVPAFAGSPMAAVNVTSTESTASGFLTVWNCADPQPNASILNYQAGKDIANLSMVKTTSPICVYTYSPTDIVLDLMAVTP